MERRSIVQSVLGAIALQHGTRTADAQTGNAAVFVQAGEDRFHEKITLVPCLLSGKDTNGALSVFGPSVRKAPPGGVPLHVHHHQDEWWYIIDGEYLFQVGDKKFRAKAGDSVFGPRGVPHSPRRLSDSSASITIFQPAGAMEEFFHEVAQVFQKNPKARLDQLFRAHGMDIVGGVVEP